MATVSLQSAFDAARRALDAGAADKAVAVAHYILAHHPRNIEAQRLLGEALLNDGDAEAAAEAFARVLDADPESVAAYYGRGLAFAAMDDRAAAARSFERALEIQPNLAELRTQLIRLYGEASGASPQLRLSRAGLARLYTRGGMYGQAVDEFRAIEADGERPDVEAALGEALWRDGQEDEAAAYCRDTLRRRPELLKLRLLHGYLLYAGGQPEGEALWRTAAQQDPSLTVARALFDILPPIRLEEPLLPAFDADELLARGYHRVAPFEPVAAAHAQAPELASSVEPAAARLPAAAELEAAGQAASAGENSYLRAPAAKAPPRDMLSDDQLLASLLGIDEPPAAKAPPSMHSGEQAANTLTETHNGEHAVAEQAQPSSSDSAIYDAPSFSLPSDDTAARPAQGADRSGGNGNTPNEAAKIEPLDAAANDVTVAPAIYEQQIAPWDEAGEPAFALGDTSRSPEADAAPWDELPGADASSLDTPRPSAQPAETRDLFSLDDLADDAPSWEQGQVTPDDEEQMPFSLAELGIDAAQLNMLQPGTPKQAALPDDAALFGWEPYIPAASGLEDVPAASQNSGAAETPAASANRQADAASFSLADLGLTDEEIAALDLNEGQLEARQTGRRDAPAIASEPNGLGNVLQQLAADPNNAALRLAVARMGIQSGAYEQAFEHYRQLVRAEKLLSDVTADLEDLLGEAGDTQLLRRLHRLLGDTYMKQNRVQDAMDQYSWTSEGHEA